MSKVVKIDRKTILSLISHILVISIVFILPEVIFTNSFTDPDHPAPLGVYIHAVVYIIVFYYNYFFLIDRLLFRKRMLLYIVSVLIFVILLVSGAEFLSSLTRPEPDGHMHGPVPGNFVMAIRNFAISLLSVGLSLALKFSMRWTKIERMNEKIMSEQKDMELANLKTSSILTFYSIRSTTSMHSSKSIRKERKMPSIN